VKLLLFTTLGVLVVIYLAVTVLGGHRSWHPVYTLAEVGTGLHRDPGSWVDRPLHVRGVALPCEVTLEGLVADARVPCARGLPVLQSETGAGNGSTFLLGRGKPDPVAALLRDLPLLGHLVPAPATVQWGVLATYRIEIIAVPNALANTLHDYKALLLDAAP
jgi:hypothetical protein